MKNIINKKLNNIDGLIKAHKSVSIGLVVLGVVCAPIIIMTAAAAVIGFELYNSTPGIADRYAKGNDRLKVSIAAFVLAAVVYAPIIIMTAAIAAVAYQMYTDFSKLQCVGDAIVALAQNSNMSIDKFIKKVEIQYKLEENVMKQVKEAAIKSLGDICDAGINVIKSARTEWTNINQQAVSNESNSEVSHMNVDLRVQLSQKVNMVGFN